MPLDGGSFIPSPFPDHCGSKRPVLRFGGGRSDRSEQVPALRSFCPRCGAELPFDFLGQWFQTSARCSECGVAPAEAPTVLPISADEVTYTLVDLPPPDRSAITAALTEGGIRYRWGPEQVLAVAGRAEAEVDRVLDDFRGPASNPEADGSAGVDLGEEAGGDGVDDGEPADIGDDDDAEQADGGEEATEAMGDLFVVADRLVHAPYDEGAGLDLTEAAATADACLPPYGIEAQVWRRVRELARSILSDLELAADEEVVVADARALRDFLRNYV